MDARISELSSLAFPPAGLEALGEAHNLDSSEDRSSDDSPPVCVVKVLHPTLELTPPALAACSSHNTVACTRSEKGGKAKDRDFQIEEERKREREHKKRSKNWSRSETLKLINSRKELDERFRMSGRKNVLWEEIAQTLQRATFSRDAQQCKDKWEKLTARYKMVRDGARDKEGHPFYDELHQLFSWRCYKRDSGPQGETVEAKRMKNGERLAFKKDDDEASLLTGNGIKHSDPRGKDGVSSAPMKAKVSFDHTTITDLALIEGIVQTVIAQQQRFFENLLYAVEKKEQMREQIRQQREEKWRAEERAERYVFQNAMIVLTQRLLGERPSSLVAATMVPADIPAPSEGLMSSQKRSKNWKRGDVMHLIRIRKQMDAKFANSSRRAALWDELGDRLLSLGVKRDGKQCREKWDKLVAEYKDVVDGKKEREESHYYAELSTILGRTVDAERNHTLMRMSNEELGHSDP